MRVAMGGFYSCFQTSIIYYSFLSRRWVASVLFSDCFFAFPPDPACWIISQATTRIMGPDCPPGRRNTHKCHLIELHLHTNHKWKHFRVKQRGNKYSQNILQATSFCYHLRAPCITWYQPTRFLSRGRLPEWGQLHRSPTMQTKLCQRHLAEGDSLLVLRKEHKE